jgi:hypothetical protein
MKDMGIRSVAGGLAFVAAAAFVVGAASPVAAATDPNTNTGAKTSAAAPMTEQDAQRKYCVKYKPTGTRFERKTCKTRAEWIKETGVDPARK